jgi:hypothetical protein
MAINLWKLQKPTSYNPLPNDYSVFVSIGIGDYVVKGKARKINVSASRFHVVSSVDLQHNYLDNLSNEFKEFSFTINSKVNQVLYIRQSGSTPLDYEVIDIQLVQKPLPTLTINGVDGFKSSKWTLHANARVIDDETLELNATANYQVNYLEIPCLPNTDYVLNFIGENSNGKGYVDYLNSSKGYISSSSLITTGSLTFKTPSTCLYMKVFFSNQTSGVGTFTFKKPMLNLGSTPAPYEKKRGERMVLPTVKKNLLPNIWEQGSIDAVNTNTFATNRLRLRVNLKKSNTHYLTIPNGFKMYLRYFNVNTLQGETGWLTASGAINPNGDVTSILLAKADDSTITPTDVPNVQLEQGTTPTPYEPYAVQVNKKPKRTTPIKTAVKSSKRSLEAKR